MSKGVPGHTLYARFCQSGIEPLAGIPYFAVPLDDFDLVLMDMQMPEMDGFEATRILHQREKSTGKHLTVVPMTALAMNGDKERCFEAGMNGYLSKPIRPEKLDDILDTYMALRDPVRTQDGRHPKKTVQSMCLNCWIG